MNRKEDTKHKIKNDIEFIYFNAKADWNVGSRKLLPLGKFSRINCRTYCYIHLKCRMMKPCRQSIIALIFIKFTYQSEAFIITINIFIENS